MSIYDGPYEKLTKLGASCEMYSEYIFSASA